jgi:hypothetical protein
MPRRIRQRLDAKAESRKLWVSGNPRVHAGVTGMHGLLRQRAIPSGRTCRPPVKKQAPVPPALGEPAGSSRLTLNGQTIDPGTGFGSKASLWGQAAKVAPRV